MSFGGKGESISIKVLPSFNLKQSQDALSNIGANLASLSEAVSQQAVPVTAASLSTLTETMTHT